MEELSLLKVGGAELQEGPALEQLVSALSALAARGPLLVVHGGGPEIAGLQQRLGLEPRFLDGLRVTDEASMQVAEMVLSGLVNKRLVARLVASGVRALGLSGVDGGLLRARPLRHPQGDLGRVGEIVAVDGEALRGMVAAGWTVALSPIALGEDGRSLNVNADHATLAVARALRVRELTFLTDVPGVRLEGALAPRLTAEAVEAGITAGQITGGMIPKVRSALEAVAAGVASARITNLEGLLRGTGTWVSA